MSVFICVGPTLWRFGEIEFIFSRQLLAIFMLLDGQEEEQPIRTKILLERFTPD